MSYKEISITEIEGVMASAQEAFIAYRKLDGTKKSEFLLNIATEIEALGDALIHKAMEETNLPEARLQGERGRTCNQLRQFAALVKEGSWVEARVDTAIPDRAPLPKPDLRKMQVSARCYLL